MMTRAGRALSRHQALRQWHGRQVIDDLGKRGIKDIRVVVEAAHAAGLARKVATLEPLICIKG